MCENLIGYCYKCTHRPICHGRNILFQKALTGLLKQSETERLERVSGMGHHRYSGIVHPEARLLGEKQLMRI